MTLCYARCLPQRITRKHRHASRQYLSDEARVFGPWQRSCYAFEQSRGKRAAGPSDQWKLGKGVVGELIGNMCEMQS